MIGRKFKLYVGGEKWVQFLVVDPECPTFRYSAMRPFWSTFSPTWFQDHLHDNHIEKVLVTPTSPVMLAIVYQTYPSLKIQMAVMSRQKFDEFRYQICVQKIKAGEINWLKEGF